MRAATTPVGRATAPLTNQAQTLIDLTMHLAKIFAADWQAQHLFALLTPLVPARSE